MQQDKEDRDAELREEAVLRKARESNLVVGGMDTKHETNDTLAEKMRRMFLDHLGVNTTVTDVLFLRKNLFKIKVASLRDRVAVLKKRMMLSTKGMSVMLFPDRSRRDRHVNDLMRQIADEERTKGRVVKVGFRLMYIDGVKFVWDDTKCGLVRAPTNETAEWD